MRLIGFVLASLLIGLPCRAADNIITVASDGSGDFKTIQDAITAVPEQSSVRITIRIKPGTYEGPFVIPKNKPAITMVGDDAAATILNWDRNVNDPIPAGSEKFNPGLLVRADDFRAVRLTIQNTSGDHGQALALKVDGDRDLFLDCRILGWQDTLMINNGRDYFQNCYIAGRVDFIYGSATAWFADCEIHSRNGGHVTAASTPQDHSYGYVFMNCKLTGDATPWDPATTNPSSTFKPRVTPQADLGRPWRAYASVSYLNCEMGDHIKPEGWNNWGRKSNETTARYSEYHSNGPGGAADGRVEWAHQLSDDQAKKVTLPTVLGGGDHWDPVSIAQSLNKGPTTSNVGANAP